MDDLTRNIIPSDAGERAGKASGELIALIILFIAWLVGALFYYKFRDDVEAKDRFIEKVACGIFFTLHRLLFTGILIFVLYKIVTLIPAENISPLSIANIPENFMPGIVNYAEDAIFSIIQNETPERSLFVRRAISATILVVPAYILLRLFSISAIKAYFRIVDKITFAVGEFLSKFVQLGLEYEQHKKAMAIVNRMRENEAITQRAKEIMEKDKKSNLDTLDDEFSNL